ncbi:MAG: flagellar filament capping protein FliD [Inhella sp.]
MATITSAGVGSGLDVESLIQRLMSLERKPIADLKQRTDGLKTQLSAVGKLQSSLASLRDISARLAQSTGFSGASASSNDAASVTASASSGAALGNYQINITRLATAQSLASNAVPAGSNIGTGTITIDFGSYSDDLSTFDADPSRTSLVIPVTAGEDQLEKIRDQINAMKAGVVASVVSDVNGSRLVMRAADTGAANAFRVSVSDDDGNNADGSGLSMLAYDPTQAINAGARKQAAQNALLSIDGVDIESASNRIDSAIQGVSLNLLRPTAGATISVAQDQEATKKLITDFANAYNDTLKLLREQTRNDPQGGSGPLRGDQTFVSVQFQLRNLIGGSTTLGGSFSRLAEIGLDPGSDGLLKIDQTKLSAALNKPADLQGLFAGQDSGNPANDGFARKLRQLGDQLLSTDGRFESRKKGLNDRIDANGDRESQLERRLELVEKRLRAQYTALDGTVGRLSGLSAYLQQQLNRL